MLVCQQSSPNSDFKPNLSKNHGHFIPTSPKLSSANGKVCAQIGWSFFGLEFFVLKTKMFRDVTTVLIEATHLRIAKSGQSQTLLVLFKTELRNQAIYA